MTTVLKMHTRIPDRTGPLEGPTGANRGGQRSCDKFLYGFKGAPSARQADRHRPRLAKDAHGEHGERERAGVLRRGGQEWWGLSPQVAGSLAHFLLRGSASSWAAADAPMPRTRP
jgi:hypothetical protein